MSNLSGEIRTDSKKATIFRIERRLNIVSSCLNGNNLNQMSLSDLEGIDGELFTLSTKLLNLLKNYRNKGTTN